MNGFFQYNHIHRLGIVTVRVNMNGAKVRPMVIDDFGNLRDLDFVACAHSVKD